MVRNMKDNGIKTKCMVKEFLLHQMETNMKDNGNKTLEMGMEPSLGQTEIVILVNGRKIIVMVMVFLMLLMAKIMLVIG